MPVFVIRAEITVSFVVPLLIQPKSIVLVERVNVGPLEAGLTLKKVFELVTVPQEFVMIHSYDPLSENWVAAMVYLSLVALLISFPSFFHYGIWW